MSMDFDPALRRTSCRCTAGRNVSDEGEKRAGSSACPDAGKNHAVGSIRAEFFIGDDEHGLGPDGIFNFERRLLREDHQAPQEAEPTTPGDATTCSCAPGERGVDLVTRVPDDDDARRRNTRAKPYRSKFTPTRRERPRRRSEEDHLRMPTPTA